MVNTKQTLKNENDFLAVEMNRGKRICFDTMFSESCNFRCLISLVFVMAPPLVSIRASAITNHLDENTHTHIF